MILLRYIFRFTNDFYGMQTAFKILAASSVPHRRPEGGGRFQSPPPTVGCRSHPEDGKAIYIPACGKNVVNHVTMLISLASRAFLDLVFFRAFWGGLQRGLAVALPERLQINLLNDSSFPAERFGELAHEKDSRGFPRESP